MTVINSAVAGSRTQEVATTDRPTGQEGGQVSSQGTGRKLDPFYPQKNPGNQMVVHPLIDRCSHQTGCYDDQWFREQPLVLSRTGLYRKLPMWIWTRYVRLSCRRSPTQLGPEDHSLREATWTKLVYLVAQKQARIFIWNACVTNATPNP